MTYSGTKFEDATSNSLGEDATSNGLGEDAFTRKYIILPSCQGQLKCYPAPSTSCDLSMYKV